MMIHPRYPEANPMFGHCPLPEPPKKRVTFAEPPVEPDEQPHEEPKPHVKCDPKAGLRCPKILEYKDKLAAIERQMCQMKDIHREIERVPGEFVPDIECPPKMECSKREPKKTSAEDEKYDDDGELKQVAKAATVSERRKDIFAPRTDGPCKETTCPGLNSVHYKEPGPDDSKPIPCDTCPEVKAKAPKTQFAQTFGKCPLLPGDPEYTDEGPSYEEACREAAHAELSNAQREEDGICPDPSATIDRNGPRTSDFYKTCKLPARMDFPTSFTSFGCQRRPMQHPFYRTSSNEYGWYAPNIHSIHTSFLPRDQSFSKSQAIGGMYRNYGLNLTDGD